MNVNVRTAVSPQHGFRLSFARADGRLCCAVDDPRTLCSPCKGAFVLGQAARQRDVLPSVQQAHDEQRHLAAALWDLRLRYGGAPLNTALQLHRAGELGKVRCGSYDLAMRAKGTEPDPVVYRRDGDEPPRGYDIALAAKRAKEGTR